MTSWWSEIDFLPPTHCTFSNSLASSPTSSALPKPTQNSSRPRQDKRGFSTKTKLPVVDSSWKVLTWKDKYSRQIAFVLQRWINTLPGCSSEILKRKCNSRIMVVQENLIGTEEQMILSSVFTFSWYTWSLFFCLGLDDMMELVYVLLQKGALSFSLVVWALIISNKPCWQFMKSSPANPAFWEHRCCNLLAADGLIIEEVSAMSQVAGSGLGLIPYPCHTLVDQTIP